MQQIMQSKQDSYNYFITVISLGLSSFCRKWVRNANSPTKYSISTLWWILQYNPAPPIHSDTNKLYLGGISLLDFLSSPPFLCLSPAWATALRGGLWVSSRTSWISALLSLSPLTHFPLLLAWLNSSMGSVYTGNLESVWTVSGYVSV